MSHIIYHHQPVPLQKIEHLTFGIGICRTGSRTYPVISIDIKFVDEKFGIFRFQNVRQRFALRHMFARITVIGHQAYIVFPITVIGIRRISDQLIDHCRSFGLRPHGKTSYTYIQRGPVKVGSLIVVQKSEIVVGYEIIFFVNALISLKSNQERIVVRRPLLSYPTVVVTSVAEKQQITRAQRFIAIGSVIEHFHKTTYGGSIGCTGRKLVIYMCGLYDQIRKRVMLDMKFAQPFGFVHEKRRRYNYKIGTGQRM